ncbi:complement factor H [Mantella aurantiaca]
MILLESLLILTGVICCTAAPAIEAETTAGFCQVPPRFPDRELQGDWNEESYKPDTTALYHCRPGFSRLGSIVYKCSNGKWIASSSGQCKKKSCGHPGDIEFGTFELKNEDGFVFGAVVEYACNEGYQMISRHRTRECTATGWTNYRPECEVRYCPPVQVNNNVNLLTTSYEEEYSVGQVIRFECKNSGQKLKGASEIYCTSEGNWNAPPPTCEEISCSPPMIEHGTVRNPNPRYKDRDTIEFSCNQGYRPSTASMITCTKNDWIPTPVCEEIVCYQETVKNGKVQYNKETYRNGDTVTLTCNEGYQIDSKPDEPRTCTAHGWSPPLKCISKQCMQLNIPNGRLDIGWSRFPVSLGRSLYYYCDSGFLSLTKSHYGTIYCTNNGWNPEPKCNKKCNVPSRYSINALIQHTQPTELYTEGDKLYFQCFRDHSTLSGQTVGEIECLPDGSFSDVKCLKTCQTPELLNGEYKNNKKVYEAGTYILYKCNDGFISSNNRAEGSSQCSRDGWQPKPECKGISCTLKEDIDLKDYEKTVKSGEVVHFLCPRFSKLEGSSYSQCFYYGWSSAIPICKDERNYTLLPSLDFSKPKVSKCPLISAPPNAQVVNPKDEYFSDEEIEIECNPGYLLYGSEKIQCKDGKWQSPPWCIEKVRCNSSPPKVQNGQITKETLANEYYTGSTVQYICTNGYHIIGSDETKCLDGTWLPPPTCVAKPCDNPPKITQGGPQDGTRKYNHGEKASYNCSPGYKLSGTEPAVCLFGIWQRIPKCIYSICGTPPNVKNAVIRGQNKITYLPREKVAYDCVGGYTMGQNANYITCEDSVWTEPPVCRRVGQTCGPPPVVQFGDIIEAKSMSYQSDSFVTFKCANYYKIEGNAIITCKDGVWEKEPVCRVPCTVKETVMQLNNIQLKFKSGEDKIKKMYSEHFDKMSFECKPGYQISDPTLLRIQCLDGVLDYPKCLKEGTCVLQQIEMNRNNIRYNKSTEIENGQTIEFECEEGLVSENSLRRKCEKKQITYPKCSAGRRCLTPNIINGLTNSDKEGSFESGTYIDIKCEDQYVLIGHVRVKCENGQWDELPKCFKSCTISDNSLAANHIELKPENPSEILIHGTEINVKCKANFKRPGSLVASCYNGIMKYPTCFSGETCRINQQNLDDNYLELHELHENEVFYEEGKTIRFKCKTGYINRTGLTGTCTKSGKPSVYTLTYPTCELESAV